MQLEGPTDHQLLSAQITCLCCALNDVGEIVKTTPGTTEMVSKDFRGMIARLKQACDAISKFLSSFAAFFLLAEPSVAWHKL